MASILGGVTAFGEEQHSVLTALSSTTLSGFVDTSAWWTGNSRTLTGASGQVSGMTDGGLTNYPQFYYWNATANGALQITLQDQWMTFLGVAEISGDQATWIASNRLGDLQVLPVFHAPIRAGHMYLVAAAQGVMSSIDPQAFQFAYQFIPAPANDDFDQALPLTGATNQISVSNRGATTEFFEPSYTNSLGGASVWYAWTPPASRRSAVSVQPWSGSYEAPAASPGASALSAESIFYPWGGVTPVIIGSVFTQIGGVNGGLVPVFPVFTVEAPVYHPIISVYDGSQLDALTLIGRGTTIVFDAEAGHTYHIAVEGNFGLYGETPLYTTQVEPPANDDFSKALGVSDVSKATFRGNFVSAQREPNEPQLGAEFSGASVWFKWKAATFGSIRLNQSSPNAALAVFTGSSLENLTLVAKSSDSSLQFFGEEGVDYYVAAYRTSPALDNFNIDVAGPTYRLYETTMAQLFPAGYVPSFYGLRGVTAILYANTSAGWNPVEFERIINEATIMTNVIRGSVEGKLRVVTIDEPLPSPFVDLVPGASGMQPVLRGIVGQTGFLSYSSNLTDWTPYTAFKLTEKAMPLAAKNASGDTTFFYRVVQSMPDNLRPTTSVGSAPSTPPMQNAGGSYSGATYSQLKAEEGYSGSYSPPVPSL